MMAENRTDCRELYEHLGKCLTGARGDDCDGGLAKFGENAEETLGKRLLGDQHRQHDDDHDEINKHDIDVEHDGQHHHEHDVQLHTDDHGSDHHDHIFDDPHTRMPLVSLTDADHQQPNEDHDQHCDDHEHEHDAQLHIGDHDHDAHKDDYATGAFTEGLADDHDHQHYDDHDGICDHDICFELKDQRLHEHDVQLHTGETNYDGHSGYHNCGGQKFWIFNGIGYSNYQKYLRAMGMLGPDYFCEEYDGDAGWWNSVEKHDGQDVEYDDEYDGYDGHRGQ